MYYEFAVLPHYLVCLRFVYLFGFCRHAWFIALHALAELSVLVACKVMALWQLTFPGFYDFFAEGSPPGNIPVTRRRFPEAE